MPEHAHTISISFDTDHMSDGRMSEFLARCPFPGDATYFCTQAYEALSGTSWELAPHPYLGKSSDWLQELRAKRAEFPDAVGWRSHSCVFSHIVAEWLAFNGYLYASTHDDFGRAGLRPSLNMWGIWQMPIYYMDNLDLSQPRFWPSANRPVMSSEIISRALEIPGTYVFDFHPIHLLLNTPDPATYASLRGRFVNGESCEQLRHRGRGAHSFFNELVEAMDKKGFKSVSMKQALLSYSPDAKAQAFEKSDYVFEDWRINDCR
jgi:hypothetical protein